MTKGKSWQELFQPLIKHVGIIIEGVIIVIIGFLFTTNFATVISWVTGTATNFYNWLVSPITLGVWLFTIILLACMSIGALVMLLWKVRIAVDRVIAKSLEHKQLLEPIFKDLLKIDPNLLPKYTTIDIIGMDPIINIQKMMNNIKRKGD